MSIHTKQVALVLGANGRFGQAAVRAFHAAGWQVVAQVRRDATPGLPKDVQIVCAPLAGRGEAVLGAIGTGIQPQVVVYAANPLYTRWEEDLLPTARAGMEIAATWHAHFMLPGNVYNYGENLPAELDETTPRTPTNPKGRLRETLEGDLERRARRGQLSATIITAGDFFGSGSGSWFDLAIAKDLAAGRIQYPGNPDKVHAWAYLPDLAAAFVRVAALSARPPFQRFTFAGHSVTGTTFIAALKTAAHTLGIVPRGEWRLTPTRWGMMRLAGVFVPMLREVVRMSYLWQRPHALSSAALEEAVGPLDSTPLVEALTRSLRELDSLGKIASPTGAPRTGRNSGLTSRGSERQT